MFYLSMSHAEPLLPLSEFERDASEEVLIDALMAQPGNQNIQDALLSLKSQRSNQVSVRGVFKPKVVNGVITADYPSTGALLSGQYADDAMHSCSGTLIGCSTFLTAAHCFCEDTDTCPQLDTDKNNYQVYFQHGGTYAISEIIPHEKHNFSSGRYDIAIVKLEAPVSGIVPSLINDRAAVDSGTSGTIVGFGRSGGNRNDYGIKRVGLVRTADCSSNYSEDEFICWDFRKPVGQPGQDSNTCNGDSGGPLFKGRIAGTRSPLIGVTNGGTEEDCLAKDHSYDAEVYNYQQWIADSVDEPIGIQECGDIPPVGSPDTAIWAIKRDLDKNNSVRYHEVSVSPASYLLRVAMNAKDDAYTDFNMYVQSLRRPTLEDSTCRKDGSGQFAVCEILNPTPGTWHIMIERNIGEGEYQVVATVFGPGVDEFGLDDR